MARNLFEGFDLYDYVTTKQPPMWVHNMGANAFNFMDSLAKKVQGAPTPTPQEPEINVPEVPVVTPEIVTEGGNNDNNGNSA